MDAEHQRHVLMMLDKALNREIILEQRVSELGQVEETLTMRVRVLEQEVLNAEEEAETALEKFYVAESTIKDLREQIIEAESRVANSSKDMYEEVVKLETELSDAKVKLQHAEALNEASQEEKLMLNYTIKDMGAVIEDMRKKVMQAGIETESAEDRCIFLSVSNEELGKELSLVRGRVKCLEASLHQMVKLETELSDAKVKLQHAEALNEASREEKIMLNSTIKDMGAVIEDMRKKVMQAGIETESAEDRCIFLSVSNKELGKELSLVRGRVKCLEASLHQMVKLETELSDAKVKLQHAEALNEASREEKIMLNSTIKDMGAVIEDMRKKVMQAGIETESAEDTCIYLSVSNKELGKELSLVRGRVKCLEASLHQMVKLETELSDAKVKLQHAEALNEASREEKIMLNSTIKDMGAVIEDMRKKVMQAGIETESAEDRCIFLSVSNKELGKELSLVRGRVKCLEASLHQMVKLETELSDAKVKLQHAEALNEASREEKIMLNSTIKDMGAVIEDMRKKVMQAGIETESAEDTCIYLSVSNKELGKELSLVRGRVKCLEASLHQMVKLETELSDAKVKLQHAEALNEASREEKIMLNSTIKDMGAVIEDMRKKVMQAGIETESAEDRCIFLSVSNKELGKELSLVRGRVKCLEASLHQMVKLETELSDAKVKLQHAEALNEASREEKIMLNSTIKDMGAVIEDMRKKVMQAGIETESAEDRCIFLSVSNKELGKELSLVRGRVKCLEASLHQMVKLETELSDAKVKLQHAEALNESSQEEIIMLNSTIKDMGDVIEDMRKKAIQAGIETESVEDRCIFLSESNEDLGKELSLVRGRVKCLEASLHQMEVTKKESAKDISFRSKLIMVMAMQMALEREGLQKQISSLKQENKILVKRLMKKDASPAVKVSHGDKANNFTTESKEALSTNFELEKAHDEAVMDSPETVRNIDARQISPKGLLKVLLFLVIPLLGVLLYETQVR